MKNEGFIERLIQTSIGVASFLGSIFWIGGRWQIFLFAFGLMVTTFAIIGFCPLYKIFKIKISSQRMLLSKKQKIIILVYACALLLAGSWASIFFSKKFFIEDFNRMNVSYKQTLFETGQEEEKESRDNYDKLVVSYAQFKNKYQSYEPFPLKGDDKFEKDLKDIDLIIQEAGENIRGNNLKGAHLELEKVRLITQDILKRNGFSMLSIALVDFHDAMEKVLEGANNKDAQAVIRTYEEADIKLKAVESEANDSEIQAIRKNLDEILKMAKNGELEKMSSQSATLKNSFVKVYIFRG
ncbi:MAG: hypothetical protein ACD_56C00146G0009 [uncultured bacterium]|nr:MAG: hypothetical protein ACD_56C00146G0009 [uncultured bacterium]